MKWVRPTVNSKIGLNKVFKNNHKYEIGSGNLRSQIN